MSTLTLTPDDNLVEKQAFRDGMARLGWSA